MQVLVPGLIDVVGSVLLTAMPLAVLARQGPADSDRVAGEAPSGLSTEPPHRRR